MPQIKLFANLRKLAGMKELSVPGATVGAAIDELVKVCPPLDGVILESEGPRPHVVMTLNGHTVTDLTTAVTEEDVLAIFPPIAGG